MYESVLRILPIFTFLSDITYETLLHRGFVWNEKKTFNSMVTYFLLFNP